MGVVEGIVSLVKEYITVENLMCIPFLMLLGRCLKRSGRISDSLIPNLLACTGIACSFIFSLAANTPQTILQWIVLFIVGLGQGYFCAMASIGIHQMFKQHKAFKILSSFSGEEETKTDNKEEG